MPPKYENWLRQRNLAIDIFKISTEIVLKWLPQDHIDYKLTLVQVDLVL